MMVMIDIFMFTLTHKAAAATKGKGKRSSSSSSDFQSCWCCRLESLENTNTTMVEIGHRIGYSHDLFQQRRLVNAELLKLPMSNT
ncbi:hypothetical protein LOK49_LG07G02311 [Camellia lanceoleosa]|uniref:Uncharacterized protein n=1 Tax=Camellia lanceoleosa TaxID=1840588 RepID=A0ACC0HAZ0_9ERIC|nr:hypothetical protein LOK49_LG07G02311 [Camellia lanceoleosa]